MRTRQILCPIDFSETASHALRYAIEMANFYQVGLRLLHVVDQPLGNENYQILAITPEELAKNMEDAAADQMGHLLCELKSDLFIETGIRRGFPIEQILADAVEFDVGMIVMASHGRSGLSHFLHTNIAEGAKCPVLVVK